MLLASVRSKLPNVGSWHVKRRDIELSLESFHEKLAAPESQSIRDYIVEYILVTFLYEKFFTDVSIFCVTALYRRSSLILRTQNQ